MSVLADVADVLTEKPIVIEIDKKPDTWYEKLWIKWTKSSKYKFTITPLRVRSLYRVASRSEKIADDILTKGIVEALMSAYLINAKDIVYIVAVGLQNNRYEPSHKLLKIIEDEFTQAEIEFVLNSVFSKINVQAFMNTIILIKGANILKMSPEEKGSQIAPGV